MSKQKTKGRNLENQVAVALTEAGIPAVRVPLSGSMSSLPGDVYVGDLVTHTHVIECKNRENLSMQLWDWQVDNDFVVLKRNYKQMLVQMPFETFTKLLKTYQEHNK